MNNGLFTDRMKVFTLAVLLTLLLSTTATAQEKYSIQTPADPKAIQKFELETPNIEILKARRAEVEAAKYGS